MGILGVLLALVGLLPRQAPPPPSPEQADTVFVDRIGLVSPQFAKDSNAWLHAREGFEAVLYIDAAPPAGPLQAWTTQTAIQWGMGKSRQDRGLAMFVFRDARLARIEVGYGLEGRLPDAWLQQMLQATLVPAFAQGRFEPGIEAVLDALQARLKDDPSAEDAAHRSGLSAWARTWADAWNHGARLLPALLRSFLQADTGERLIILAFVLPMLAVCVMGVVMLVATAELAAKMAGWMRVLRQADMGDAKASAAKAKAAGVPDIVVQAGPRLGPLLMLVPIALGAFVVLMCSALLVFVFSMAPDRLARQGQYGGGGVTVTWPAPAQR